MTLAFKEKSHSGPEDRDPSFLLEILRRIELSICVWHRQQRWMSWTTDYLLLPRRQKIVKCNLEVTASRVAFLWMQIYLLKPWACFVLLFVTKFWCCHELWDKKVFYRAIPFIANSKVIHILYFLWRVIVTICVIKFGSAGLKK